MAALSAFSRTLTGIAASGRETIFTIPVLGEPERIVGRGLANDWSSDGTLILALVTTEREPASWRVVSFLDGSSRQLMATPAGSTLRQARFSPDGSKVFYVEQTAPAESHLNEIDVAGGQPKRISITALRAIDSFAWAGPNHLVVAGTTAQSVVQRFYYVQASGGAPELLPFGANGSDLHTCPGAKSLVYTYNELSENIWRVAAWPGADRQPRKLITTDGPTMNPAVSPADGRIAFTSSRTGKLDHLDERCRWEFCRTRRAAPEWDEDGGFSGLVTERKPDRV